MTAWPETYLRGLVAGSAPRPAGHGPVEVTALGEDRYRLRCSDPRCPALVTTVTSPGGVKAFRRQHRGRP